MARKLKVFLSSTAQDLTAFRKAVHARLAASPLFEAVRQEDFDLQSNAAVDLCHQQVQKADLFIGLVGMRRGWEPPGDPDRRSITEMEYDWAKAVAPRFLYVAPQGFPVPGNLRESDAQHRRQIDFRQRVMSELVVSQDGFVSPEKRPTPDIFARRVVDELTHHVLSGDLIEPARPQSTPNHEALSDAVAAKVLQALEERGDITRAEQGGLERDIVFKLAKRLKPDDALDFDRAIAELENAIALALDVIARGRRGTNEDDFVNDVLKSVAEHTQAGDIDRATQAVDAALKELDTREAEQREALKRSRLTLLHAGIEQDILRRDAASVARRVEQSVVVEHSDDADLRFAKLRHWHDEFRVEGRDKGINFSLEAAAEIARRAIDIADDTDQRGAALNDLGNALQTLGARQSGTERLDEAVAAYRRALDDRPRQLSPLDWAMTQNNLGAALQTLGERESGTARLDEAVAAYREALKEYTRQRAPLDWAMTQNNLGIALQTLGEREPGTDRLDEAVAAYREALKERTRDRVPRDWAATQNNLGNVLANLGNREKGAARLEEAVHAYHEALKEMTRDRVPLDWATTLNNLANVLQTLGAREHGTQRLDEAVAAYRDALKERTRERVPLDWAATQNNLGTALAGLGERRRDASSLEDAINCYRETLLEWTPDRVPLDWAMTQNNLGNALLHAAAFVIQLIKNISWTSFLQEATFTERGTYLLKIGATRSKLPSIVQALIAPDVELLSLEKEP